MEDLATFAQVYKVVLQLCRQVSISHQGYAHRIDFPIRAVIAYKCSQPLSSVPTHSLSFKQLFADLESAILLSKEAGMKMLWEKAGKFFWKVGDKVAFVTFAGQGRYRKYHNNRPSCGSTKFNLLSIPSCFNYKSSNHIVKDCPKPLNAAQAAARRVEYFNKKRNTNALHVNLADLYRQLVNSI